MSRNELFAEELDKALAGDEIQRGLSETKSITGEVLRERCLRESDRIWDELREQVKAFDISIERVERVEALGKPGRVMWNFVTSWRTYCLLPLVGLLLIVLGFQRAGPGASNTVVSVSVLVVVEMFFGLAALVFLTDSGDRRTAKKKRAHRARRRGDVPSPVLLIGIGVALFYLEVVRVVRGDELKTVQGADEAGWLAIASAFTGALVFAPLLAGLNRGVGRRRDLLGLWLLAATSVSVPVMFFLVSQIDSMKMLTGTPDLVFVIAGEVVLAASGLIVLVGRWRPTVEEVRAVHTWRQEALIESLVQEHVLPFLRGEISRHLDDFSVQLNVPDAPGISQVFDSLYRVPTAAAARVGVLLKGMPGGSIGLAGSRGSGKTTLMESYCVNPDKTLATMVAAPVEYAAREFLLHLYSKVCMEVLGEERDMRFLWERARAERRRANRIIAVMSSGFLVAALGMVVYGFSREIQTAAPSQLWGLALLLSGLSVSFVTLARESTLVPRQRRNLEYGSSLRARAADRLEEIRYQQTYTTTATGTVKLPIGIEGALSKARGLVRQPMHLPEIVDSLRSFLAEVAHDRGRVIIGIDELDKMKSETAAEQFLNEIKGIFGIKNVYFLVSVSEEAMSTFERRGLPFRDVFDSTFDEIVWFDHLSTVEATATIDRRVLVPIPFKQLCFTLSGGLPRDLIRVVRMMLDSQQERPPTSLRVIAKRLVSEDVRRKTRAVVVAARRLDAEPLMSCFLATCDEVARREIDHDVLARLTGEIVPGDIMPVDEATRQLCRLIGELAGFYYYAATLLEFFDDDADEERWQVAGAGNEPRSLGSLATARQAFATSPSVAWQGVSRFRHAWGFDVLEYPPALTGRRETHANGHKQRSGLV
ncbi:P-loop NTPase fold protein [Lentzea sp. JNUCC 0626]|uniref:P-loop NTPase fold protein n=1 Tax=Lentzea sp. JNUCC 0626 TaxID=3367513 RepID=UPI003749936B